MLDFQVDKHKYHIVGFIKLRKPAFCSYCAADQRLCFRYSDTTITLLSQSEISYYVAVRPGLCWTWSDTPEKGFSQRGSCVKNDVRPLAICLNFSCQMDITFRINKKTNKLDIRQGHTCFNVPVIL